MQLIPPVNAPGIGLAPGSPFKVRVYNRTGGTLNPGDLVQLDLENTATEVLSGADIGDDESIFANAVKATANGVQHGIFAVVADEDIADDAAGLMILSGTIDANVSASATVKPGDPLIAVSTQTVLDGDIASNAKVLGIAIKSITSPGAAPGKSGKVFFNGFGFATGY